MVIGRTHRTRYVQLAGAENAGIPKVTHQQFAVLSILRDEEQWGRDVRAALKADGYSSTNASFYEMMDRMESGGLVEGRYEERDVLGQKFKERRYKITGPRPNCYGRGRGVLFPSIGPSVLRGGHKCPRNMPLARENAFPDQEVMSDPSTLGDYLHPPRLDGVSSQDPGILGALDC